MSDDTHNDDVTHDGPDTEPAAQEAPDATPAAPDTRSRVLIGLAVVVVFAVIIGVRLFDRPAEQPVDFGADAPAAVDPVVAIDEALAAGDPVVVLFSSGGCPPCIEMKEIVSRVMPEYVDTVAYVDAPTGDQRTRPLFQRFQFQFVPTTIFLTPDGAVLEQHTGAMSETDFRARLDALVAASE